jgi:hypothetical protein
LEIGHISWIVPLNYMTPLEKDAVLYAKTGKTEKLAECLAKGVSPHFDGLLYYAAGRGHERTVELLLARGAEANSEDQRDSEGLTPLHFATLGGHRRIVEILLAHDADPNIKDDNGATALRHAREAGHKEIISLLEKVTQSSAKPVFDAGAADTTDDDETFFWKQYDRLESIEYEAMNPVQRAILGLAHFVSFTCASGILHQVYNVGFMSLADSEAALRRLNQNPLADAVKIARTMILECAMGEGLSEQDEIFDDWVLDGEGGEEIKLHLEMIDKTFYAIPDTTNLCAQMGKYLRNMERPKGR